MFGFFKNRKVEQLNQKIKDDQSVINSVFYDCLTKAESKKNFEKLLSDKGLSLYEIVEDEGDKKKRYKIAMFGSCFEIQGILYDCLSKAESQTDFEKLLSEKGLSLYEIVEDGKVEDGKQKFNYSLELFSLYNDKSLEWEKTRKRKEELKRTIQEIEQNREIGKFSLGLEVQANEKLL
ncbi:hypothetical protein MHK_003716 [Candidatus Magnetomorum sp. HK-1]|nr:hypothetical protein MHK_003716 [Candidatus Magnetomorum sp. HK-1]